MDKIYNSIKIFSKQDVANVIKKVEELASLNAELEELLYRGSNDEKLVDRKIELQNAVRKLKTFDLDEPIKEDEDLTSLKSDYNFVIQRYKARKLRLESEINFYKNGS